MAPKQGIRLSNLESSLKSTPDTCQEHSLLQVGTLNSGFASLVNHLRPSQLNSSKKILAGFNIHELFAGSIVIPVYGRFTDGDVKKNAEYHGFHMPTRWFPEQVPHLGGL